jgi:AcrR family transcriptional regulator
MARPVKPSQDRRSGQRQKARATRRRIREAALRLFVERGYLATTIEAIAAGAAVAVQTVYFVFGSKRALLAEVLDVATVGDDAPVPMLERQWVAEARRDDDPRRAVRLIAHHGCQIVARLAPLYEVVRGAAAADSEIALLLQRDQERRLATQTELVRLLAEKGALAPGLGVARAADVVFALMSHEVHQLLVVDRGWSLSAWEGWLADTLAAQLLAQA